MTPPSANGISESDQLWRAYSRVTTPHPAMASDEVEASYTRTLVDLLLHVLVQSPHLETCTGRYVVAELINCNVLLPLFATLSDPDWLNLLIVDIFRKSSKSQERIVPESLTSTLPPSPAEFEPAPQQETTCASQNNTEVLPPRDQAETVTYTETDFPEPSAYDVIDSEEVDCQQNNMEEEEPSHLFTGHYMRGRKSNPFYQENDSDLESPLADFKRISIDSLDMIGRGDGLYDRQKECATSVESNNGMGDDCPDAVNGSCPQVLVNSEPVENPNCCGPLLERTPEGTLISSLQNLGMESSSPSANPDRELLLGVERTGHGITNELTVVSPLQGSSPMPSFSFEPLSSPDGPVIIQNLRITGTITAKEHRGTGSHPYTLYTIKVRKLSKQYQYYQNRQHMLSLLLCCDLSV